MNHHHHYTFLAFILPLLIACGGEDPFADPTDASTPTEHDGSAPTDAEPPRDGTIGTEDRDSGASFQLTLPAYVDVLVSPDPSIIAPVRLAVSDAAQIRLQIRTNQHLLEIDDGARHWTVLQSDEPWGSRANIQKSDFSTFSVQLEDGTSLNPGQKSVQSVTLQFSDHPDDVNYVLVAAEGMLYRGLDPNGIQFVVRFAVRR